MGIPLSDTCFVYGDNKSVLYNTTLPESILKNKRNFIAYHAVREGVATGEWITGYEPTDTNISDLFKKPIPGGESRIRIFSGSYVLYLIGLVVHFHSLGFSHTDGKICFLTIVQLGLTTKFVSKLLFDDTSLRRLI